MAWLTSSQQYTPLVLLLCSHEHALLVSLVLAVVTLHAAQLTLALLCNTPGAGRRRFGGAKEKEQRSGRQSGSRSVRQQQSGSASQGSAKGASCC